MMPRNGGVNMAKKVQQSWPHTEDELWVILLDYCQELGRVPSRRNLQKYNLVKADELLVVLGKGQAGLRSRWNLNGALRWLLVKLSRCSLREILRMKEMSSQM